MVSDIHEDVEEAIASIERNWTGQDMAGVPRAAAALDVMVLMKAARRVANLDMKAATEAAYTVMHTYRIEDAKQVATAAVNAALGITEDAKQRKTFRDDEGGDLAGGGGPPIRPS